MSIAVALRSQPQTVVCLEAIILVLIIGFLDYIGGRDVSMFLFYALPILLVVIFVNRTRAFFCATLCAVIWFWAKKDIHPYSTPAVYIWATFNRFAYFVFVVVGGAALKTKGEDNRARMDALARTSELEKEIVRVSEREQMRIAQDLHDGLCQNLAAIGCAAACLKTDLQAKALPEAEAAEVIQKLLRVAVVEARDLARGIFPVQMGPESLRVALDELVATTNRHRPSARVTFETGTEVNIFDPQLSMHLYRIAQQALNNALTHAQAKRIVIRLHQSETRLVVTVLDDGQGFLTEVHSRGIGLQTMRYRARQVGAQLSVQSSPGAGTAVHCVIHLPRPAGLG